MQIDTFLGYQQFMAIKLHFTGTYDFFKYNGKTRMGWKQFEKFPGKRIIHTLLHKHKEKYVEFVATGFATDPTLSWVGDFLGGDADKHWTQHLRYMQAIKHNYQNELQELMELADDDIRKVLLGGGDLPLIERRRQKGLTSIETCCILDDIFQYINRNDCKHPLWEKTKAITDYSPFLALNRATFVEVTKKVVN